MFVLLDGHCSLLIGEGKVTIENNRAVEMVPKKIYNIRKGDYHNHALSQDADVLIIENVNTSFLNSERL